MRWSAVALRPFVAALAAVTLLCGVIVLMGGHDPAVAVREPAPAASPVGTSEWELRPFAPTSPWNATIPPDRAFEPESDSVARALSTARPVVNRASWSVSVRHATVSDPLVTLLGVRNGASFTVHIPADTVATAGNDRHVTVIQPDGTTAYDMYKFEQLSSGEWVAQYVVVVDLRGQGINGGTRASGMPAIAGLIRNDELAERRIDHAVALGVPGAVLRPGYVWPANRQDSDTSMYDGEVPMGALLAIPRDVDLSWIPLTSPEGRALARALQDYGAYVVDRSNTAAIFCELACHPDQAARLERDWARLYPYLRVAATAAE